MASTTTENVKSHKKKMNFYWDIAKINVVNFKSGEFFDSSIFYCDEDPKLRCDWKLRLYPSGLDQKGATRDIIVGLIMADSHGKDNRIKGDCKISVLDGKRKVIGAFSRLGRPDSLVFSLRKNEMMRKCATLSIHCYMDVTVDLHSTETASGNSSAEPQSVCKTEIQKGNTTTTSFVAAQTEQILKLQSNIQIKYTAVDEKNVTITLMHNSEVNNFWCLISHKSDVRDINLVKGCSVTLSYPNCTSNLIELNISVRFAALTQMAYNDIFKMLAVPTFGNITIQVGKKNLYAHKEILKASSSVFAALLSQSIPTLIIVKFSFDVLRNVLMSIYGGMINYSDVDLVELFKAASYYRLVELRQNCQQELQKAFHEGKDLPFFIELDDGGVFCPGAETWNFIF